MGQLAEKWRTKYPDAYDDLDDDELEQLVTKKYPGAYDDLVQKKEEKSSILSKVWNKASEPLTEAPTRFAESVSKYINPESQTKGARGIGSAFIEGLGHAVSGLSSPLNLGLAALSGGSSLASKAGLEAAAEALHTGTRVLSAPIAAEGVKHISESKDLPSFLSGVLETGLGALGTASKFHGSEIKPSEISDIRTASEHPTIRQSVEQPYKFNGNLPKVDELPIRRPIRDISQELPPDLVRVGGEDIFNAPRRNTPIPDSEETIFKNAQDKFNMGKEIPLEGLPKEEKPTATFKGMQETGDPSNPTIPLFDIQGGEANGSTVSLEGLQKYGIEVPDYEISNERPKSGQQLRDEAIANREKKFNPFKGKTNLSQIEEPLAARTSEGKLAIGADVKSLGKVLGTSLYKGDIAPIATKELLQNSIDAVRHLGKEGKIDVIFDRHNNEIHVSDNGKGLTRQELESVFTDLGASGKREDVNAAGGFGLAKAAPLLGGEHVEVTSIARDPKTGKLIKNSFSGTPDELLEGVNVKQESVTEGTSTGTTVKVKVPKNSDFYQASKFVDNLSEHSPSVESQIRVGDNFNSGKFDPEDIYNTKERGSGTSIAKLESQSATTELIEPKNSKRSARSYMDLNLSNNGMYQGTKTMYFDSEIPNLPKSITVDIRSKVPEGHGDYPFTANREELRGSVNEQVKQYINDNIVAPSVGKRVDELKRLYTSMPEVRIGLNKKISLYDPKGQITSEEMNYITSNQSFINLARGITGTLDEAMKVVDNPSWNDRLEKVGIIFDDKVHGIHIPNPGTKKSAILVNPFIAIDKMSPDEASANILHTILHEMAHIEPSGPGHNESFTIRLGEIYGKFGARRSVEAQDNILKSIADPNTGIYHPEIQEVLQKYKESRGREATQDDLLSGTGIGSKSGKGGQGAIPPSDRSDGEGVVESAINKLFNAMGKIKENRVEQDIINKQERARRFAAFGNVKEEGILGAKKSLGALKGEFEKVDVDKLKIPKKEADTLFTAIKQSKISDGEKARGYTALFKILNGDSLPQRNELAILDDVFGNGFASKIVEMHGGLGGVNIKLTKTANTMKAMRSSIDLSAPLRQGIGLIHRPEYREAFQNMFKYFGDKEVFDSAMKAIEDDPLYSSTKKAGLFLAKHNSVTNSEEAFANSYVHNLPKPIKAPIEASERAYTGFLNELRFKTFKNLVANAKEMGHEVEITKKLKDAKGDFLLDESGNVQTTSIPSPIAENLAKYINISTGRGGLGRLERIAPELNTVLWSPRLISSRLSVLNPKYYVDLDPFSRKEAIKSLFAIAATGSTVTSLGVLAGGKTNLDPTSADFMKARFGKNVLDPFAGFQQPIVAASRMITESHRMATGGKKAFNKPNIPEIGANFMVNKLSPATGLAYDIATAQKFTRGSGSLTSMPGGDYTSKFGQKKNIGTEVMRSFVPMFTQDVYDVFHSDAGFAEQVGLDTASLFGMGVQNYEEHRARNSNFRQMKP